jgi:NAD-dependent deacetylase
MHGTLNEVRCSRSKKVFPCNEDILETTPCTCCGKTGTLRPNVVWFGEEPLFLDQIFRALQNCARFIAVGTSGQVYPAAGFVEQARMRGARHAVELNAERTPLSYLFTDRRFGPATEIVPAFVQELLRQIG